MKKTHCKYKVYLLNTQEFVITFYCKFATFCFKIDTVCGFTLLLYQQLRVALKSVSCMKFVGDGIQNVE